MADLTSSNGSADHAAGGEEGIKGECLHCTAAVLIPLHWDEFVFAFDK